VWVHYDSGPDIYTPFPDYEEEVPTTGSSTQRVTFSANGQVAVARKKVGSGAAALYSLHTDQLGNVAAVANSAGVYVTDSYAMYEPFGAFLLRPTGTNPSVTDRGFTGQKSNNLSPAWLGLVYMNARYYHPQLGRFVSPDTIVPEPENPQSFNRYAYSYNNPINYTDPSGHDATCWTFGGGNVGYVSCDEWMDQAMVLLATEGGEEGLK